MAENTGINEFSLDDFHYTEPWGNIGGGVFYILEKPCIIFFKEIVEHSLTVYPADGSLNENNLLKVNEYIKWLGNCKDELIRYYCEFINEKFGKNKKNTIEEKWYETLIFRTVKIYINEDGKLSSEIYCYRELEEHVPINDDPKSNYFSLEIKTEGFNISSMDIAD